MCFVKAPWVRTEDRLISLTELIALIIILLLIKREIKYSEINMHMYTYMSMCGWVFV